MAQIFNVASGSVPVLGTDSTGFATAQPAGAWLPYSTATRGPNVLTVQYKTDPARTFVYKYDATKNPAVQPTSGSPIYVITSTGTAGGDVRRVRAEIYARPVIANVFRGPAGERESTQGHLPPPAAEPPGRRPARHRCR